jgi:cytochrome c553
VEKGTFLAPVHLPRDEAKARFAAAAGRGRAEGESTGMSERSIPRPRSRIGFAAVVLAVALALVLVAGGAVAVLGLFDVSARQNHSAPVAWFLHYVMRRSVAAHAAELTPPDLDSSALILRGARHFATGCAPCHGAPGQLASPIARQMTPTPPPLYSAARQFTPDELFWIIQNGVKMTAMPGWPASDRADEVWAMVAFVEQLPRLNTEAYRRLAGDTAGEGFLGPSPGGGSGPGGVDPAPCARCHGPGGEGREGAFPQIAGLPALYIAASLRAFRDGDRHSGFMQPIAAAMDDAAIEAAARYYSQLPRKSVAGPPANQETLARGAAVFDGKASNQQAPACTGCHAGGGTAAIPDLRGQPADYLLTQLQLLAGGERGGPEPGRETMARAHGLAADDMRAVAAYLASLAP